MVQREKYGLTEQHSTQGGEGGEPAQPIDHLLAGGKTTRPVGFAAGKDIAHEVPLGHHCSVESNRDYSQLEYININAHHNYASLQRDHAIPGVTKAVLVPHLDVVALELEADLGHGVPVQVPRDVRAGVLHAVLGELVLAKELWPVGVALVRLLVNVKTPGEPKSG